MVRMRCEGEKRKKKLEENEKQVSVLKSHNSYALFARGAFDVVRECEWTRSVKTKQKNTKMRAEKRQATR